VNAAIARTLAISHPVKIDAYQRNGRGNLDLIQLRSHETVITLDLSVSRADNKFVYVIHVFIYGTV